MLKRALEFFNIEYTDVDPSTSIKLFSDDKLNEEDLNSAVDLNMFTRINDTLSKQSKQKIEKINKKYCTSHIYYAMSKSLGYFIQNYSGLTLTESGYKSYMKTSYNEQRLRLNIKSFEAKCRYAFNGYMRDSKFNRPGYIEKPVDLSFIPVKYIITNFNCWGIGHDCIIQTADGIRCRWDFKRQKLVKL